MISVENLSVSYYGNEVVSKISFKVGPGTLVGIIGPNGAGKSTMIKGLLDLIPKDSGNVLVDGMSIKDKCKEIAYVPQRSDLDWDFPINVFETVLMGTYPSLGLFKKPGDKEKKLVLECLKRVDMLDYKDQQIGELSGGQQQRVFLARALAQEADLFFLDEPFVGIDVASENRIVAILRELKAENKTIFVVHHDLSKVEAYFDEMILMNKELIDAGPVSKVFNFETMSKAYESDFGIPMMKGAHV